MLLELVHMIITVLIKIFVLLLELEVGNVHCVV